MDALKEKMRKVFSKKTKVLSAITSTISILGAVLNYYFILNYGITGAAYSLIIIFGMLFITVFYYSNKIYRMPWFYMFK